MGGLRGFNTDPVPSQAAVLLPAVCVDETASRFRVDCGVAVGAIAAVVMNASLRFDCDCNAVDGTWKGSIPTCSPCPFEFEFMNLLSVCAGSDDGMD